MTVDELLQTAIGFAAQNTSASQQDLIDYFVSLGEDPQRAMDAVGHYVNYAFNQGYITTPDFPSVVSWVISLSPIQLTNAMASLKGKFYADQIEKIDKMSDADRMMLTYEEYSLMTTSAKLIQTKFKMGRDVMALSKVDWLVQFFTKHYTCDITSDANSILDAELKVNKDVLVNSQMYKDFLAFMQALHVYSVHRHGGTINITGTNYHQDLENCGLFVDETLPVEEKIKMLINWFVAGACVEFNQKKSLWFKGQL